MGPVRPSVAGTSSTDRLYLRVIALGFLWCVLGVALGSNLYLRLQSVSSAATTLSCDILPIEQALSRLDERIAEAAVLADRYAFEGRAGNDTAALGERLRWKLLELERALEFDPARTLSGAARDAATQIRSDAAAIIEASRRLLDRTAAPASDTTLIENIHELRQRADAGIEHLGHQVMGAEVNRLASDLVAQSRRIISEAIITGCVAFALGALLTVAVGKRVRQQELAQALDRDRQEFHARVSDALGMAQEEQGAFRVIEEILHRVAPETPAELLLADSSRAHMAAVVSSSTSGWIAEGCDSMCGVKTPSQCPAVRRGYPITFENSDDFDACPHLRHRAGGTCGATCVPLSIMGQHVGVLHAIAPVAQPLPPNTVERLTMLAAKAGERLGVIRAFAQSEHQAARDSLTGLLNRRSVEAEVQRLQREGTPFCIAYADIDHFKRLNDTHGHETGDKALRLLARVLREALRPTDITGRWGGEEFVVLLPRLDIETARVALDRVRSAIVDASASAGLPKFSVSLGLANCQADDDFFERLAEADAALLSAKASGRNRVMVAHETTPVLGSVKAA